VASPWSLASWLLYQLRCCPPSFHRRSTRPRSPRWTSSCWMSSYWCSRPLRRPRNRPPPRRRRLIAQPLDATFAFVSPLHLVPRAAIEPRRSRTQSGSDFSYAAASGSDSRNLSRGVASRTSRWDQGRESPIRIAGAVRTCPTGHGSPRVARPSDDALGALRIPRETLEAEGNHTS
jgi:hypothetical protein